MKRSSKPESNKRKRFLDIGYRLSITSLPILQQDALTELCLWFEKSSASMDPCDIKICKEFCLSICGLRSEAQPANIREYLMIENPPVSNRLVCDALSFLLQMHITLEKNGNCNLVSFLNWLCVTIRSLRKLPNYSLPSNVLLWYTHKCVEEAIRNTKFFSPIPLQSQREIPFNFNEAISVVFPFHDGSYNNDLLRLITYFLQTLFKNVFKEQRSDIACQTFDTLLQEFWIHLSTIHISSYSLITSIVSLTLEHVDFFNSVNHDVAFSVFEGLILTIQKGYCFHTHTFIEQGKNLSSRTSCSFCDHQNAALVQIVNFLLSYLNLSGFHSSRVYGVYSLVLQVLIQHVELFYFYRDYEASELITESINKLISLYYLCTKKLHSQTVFSSIDFSYFLSFVLWSNKVNESFLIECLNFLRLFFLNSTPFVTSKETENTFYALQVERLALSSTVLFSIHHMIVNLASIENCSALLKIVLEFKEILEEYFDTKKNLITNTNNDLQLFLVEKKPFLFSLVHDVIVDTLLTCFSQSPNWDFVSNVFENLYGKDYLHENYDMEKFVLGVFLFIGVTTDTTIILAQVLVVNTTTHSLLNCSICSRNSVALGILCRLRYWCIVWLFNYGIEYDVVSLGSYLSIFLSIVTSNPNSFYTFCPKIRSLIMMVMASWGSEKLLVPGIYRAFSCIISPSSFLCSLDSVPQLTLHNLCVGLAAYGKLYSEGQLSLSKINPLLIYKSKDPDLIRIIRLRIYNMMAESQPSDAVESLNNIQTALKDSNDIVNSEALSCLCRLCCLNMLYFNKVWTILNGKHYSTTMLTLESFTSARIQAVSSFLKEYTLREVVPNMIRCRETHLTCGALNKKTLPPDIATAVQIIDVLILMIHAQLLKTQHAQELSDFHLMASNLSNLIETCGLLGEQFYLVSKQESLWNSFLARPSNISCIVQKHIDNLSSQYKTCSSISQAIWTKILEPNYIFSLTNSSVFLFFFLAILHQWIPFRSNYLLRESVAKDLLSLSSFDPVQNSVSYSCFLCIRPFISQLGRKRDECSNILPSSASLLIKSLKPYVKDISKQQISSSTLSLLRLSTTFLLGEANVSSTKQNKHDIWSLIIEILPRLPSFFLLNRTLDFFFPYFWNYLFKRTLGRFDEQKILFSSSSDGTNAKSTDANILVLSLLNLLYWDTVDEARIQKLRSKNSELYIDTSDIEKYTCSGSPETFLHVMYAITALCSREDVQIDLVECVFELFLNLFQRSGHSYGIKGGLVETDFDVHELPFEFPATSLVNLTLLYSTRLPSRQFENLCLNCLNSFLKEQNAELLKIYDALNIIPNVLVVPIEIIPLISRTLVCFSEHHWTITQNILKVQAKILLKLCSEDFFLMTKSHIKLNVIDTAAQSLSQTLEFIESINTTHKNLELVNFVLHQMLYPTYLNSNPVHKLCLVCPIIIANTLLLQRKENCKFFILILKTVFVPFTNPLLCLTCSHDLIRKTVILNVDPLTNLQNALDDTCEMFQKPLTSSLPYTSCASALVFLQDMFLNRNVKNTFQSPFNNLAKTCLRVRQLLALKIQLSLEQLNSSTFINSSSYSEDIWEKRLALLVLNGISIKHETSYSSRFQDESLAISDAPHLIQLIKVLGISDFFPTHESSVDSKRELSFVQLFSPAANPCFVYQSILILGVLFQQLMQPRVHGKIILEDIQQTDFSSSSTNALLIFMQWVINLSNQLTLKDWIIISKDSIDPHVTSAVSMLSTLWTSLSFTETLPAINTAPSLVNNLKFSYRAIDTTVALEEPKAKLVQRELLILQVAILRCCLRLGLTDAKHDKIISYFITHTFQTVASQCFENTPHYFLKDTVYRFVYFNTWNALIILFFRLPFSQFVIHFTLGVLSLPKPKDDPIVWVFVLQQLVHLTAMLCTLCKGSMRDHCSKIFVGITSDSLLNTVADKKFYSIHSRYQQNVTCVGKEFCEEILQTCFSKYFAPHLFTVLKSDSTCQFNPTVPLCVQSSFAELFCSYIRLKLLVVNKDFSQVSNHLSIIQIPIILLAHLSVQNLCYEYSLINIFCKKLFDSEEIEDTDCNDFALSLSYLSMHYQRLCLKDIFYEASTTQNKCFRARKILQFFFFHTQFKFQPLYKISNHENCAPIPSVHTIQQTWTTKLLATQTLPVMSSRELFVTDIGILYLSQLVQPPNYFQPIVIPARERVLSKQMHLSEQIVSTWSFPSTVIFPVPSCFMPTLYTVLNRLNFPQNQQTNSCTKLSPNTATTMTTIHFESYLDLLYLFPKEFHTFVSSDVLNSCLKKRYKSLVAKCLFNTYFSACGDLQMPSQISSSTLSVNTPTNPPHYSFLLSIGRQILLELFDTQSNKETILHLFTNTFFNSLHIQ